MKETTKYVYYVSYIAFDTNSNQLNIQGSFLELPYKLNTVDSVSFVEELLSEVTSTEKPVILNWKFIEEKKVEDE